MIRYLKTSCMRTATGLICSVLEFPFFYEPPINRLKAFLLNAFLGAHIAPSAVLLRGSRILHWKNLHVGDATCISNHVTIRAHDTVKIGCGVTVGPEVFISSGDHSLEDLSPTSAPITIGDGVFVGSRAVILKGVSIGNHAVIGAGAVVTRDVPELAVCAGIPARVVKFRKAPSRTWTILGYRNYPSSIESPVQGLQTRGA